LAEEKEKEKGKEENVLVKRAFLKIAFPPPYYFRVAPILPTAKTAGPNTVVVCFHGKVAIN
jgi:hypothetical protein